MDIDNISIEDLKKYRPDLFQDLRQEVYLGELRLTKDDIISLIEPLSDNIKNHLNPYLSKLPKMTYNDIVDLGNDIIDEISEQLLNEFEELEHIFELRPKEKSKRIYVSAPIHKIHKKGDSSPIVVTCKLDLTSATLDDLKRQRPDLRDLLYDEFMKVFSMEKSKQKNKSKEEPICDVVEVKLGDVIRIIKTNEEGVVIGFDSACGKRKFIVEQDDGTRFMFKNDPKLFRILEGNEKENVITKREKYIAESKD